MIGDSNIAFKELNIHIAILAKDKITKKFVLIDEFRKVFHAISEMTYD